MREQKKKMKHSVKIEYHADDYGLFPVQSERILDCHVNGRLNGVSIMPNSDYLQQCIDRLQPYSQEIAVSVHLNLIEGSSLCARNEVPALTDKDGILCGSFFHLLLRSFLPGRQKYKQQLKKELRAQIHAVRERMPEETSLRLDSHAHYHMIPVVFDALMEVIQEEKLEISYIRIPKEYPGLYLRHWRELKDISYVNLLKVLVLNLLARRSEWKYADELKAIPRKLFLGVFLSGRMHYENVSVILPDAVALAQTLGWDMELLAHPGGVYEENDIGRITCEEDRVFMTSEMRKAERTLFTMDWPADKIS